MFAYHLMALHSGTVGSAHDIYEYMLTAPEYGHEIVIYGPPSENSPFRFSLDLEATDALVFVFEWTTHLRDGDHLDFARFVTKVPRSRRVVIDCDGAYNDLILAGGDRNHPDEAASRAWSAVCDSLSDKICQPTLSPLRRNVRPFLFYGFNPASASAYTNGPKDYGMVYVGHSKLRWSALARVLRAIEPIRYRLGRIALVGHGWDAVPPWAAAMDMEQSFYTDRPYLESLGVEFIHPVRFDQVIPWMSRAAFNPVLLRPFFERLHLVTPRLFETLSANTLPVFAANPDHVRRIYGDGAEPFILPDSGGEEALSALLRDPRCHIERLEGIRQHLADRHSHKRRLVELVEIVEGMAPCG